MSVSQVLAALPTLAPADLLAIRRKLLELSAADEDVALCDAAALEGARLLDQMEEEHGRRTSRRQLAG